MFGETTISDLKIWNHPIETTISDLKIWNHPIETTISNLKIWNHPIETTISNLRIWNYPIETTVYTWLFGVPGEYITFNNCHLGDTFWLLRLTHILRLNGWKSLPNEMAAKLAAKTNNIIYCIYLVVSTPFQQK